MNSVIPRFQTHMPTESWWLDYADFYARAREEQQRMRQSWFGQTDVLHTGVDVIPEKPRKGAKEGSE
jgi:hypothetical protein